MPDHVDVRRLQAELRQAGRRASGRGGDHAVLVDRLALDLGRKAGVPDHLLVAVADQIAAVGDLARTRWVHARPVGKEAVRMSLKSACPQSSRVRLSSAEAPAASCSCALEAIVRWLVLASGQRGQRPSPPKASSSCMSVPYSLALLVRDHSRGGHPIEGYARQRLRCHVPHAAARRSCAAPGRISAGRRRAAAAAPPLWWFRTSAGTTVDHHRLLVRASGRTAQQAQHQAQGYPHRAAASRFSAPSQVSVRRAPANPGSILARNSSGCRRRPHIQTSVPAAWAWRTNVSNACAPVAST